MPEDSTTPALIFRFDRVIANIDRFHARIPPAVHLRAHIKAHKVWEIAREQLARGASGIAVSRVAEAEVYASHGVDDIVIAWCWRDSQRWRDAARIARMCSLCVHVDNAEAIDGYAAAAATAGVSLRVRLEVDSGLGRGVDAATAVTLAKRITSSPPLQFEGVTTYRGLIVPPERWQRWQRGFEEAAIAVNVAEAIQASGINVPVVAAGSTATAEAAASFSGITEVGAGAYAVGDAGMVAIDAMARESIAASVVARVVACHGDGLLVLDAPPEMFTTAPYSWMPADYCGDSTTLCNPLVASGNGYIVKAEATHPAPGDLVATYPAHVCPVIHHFAHAMLVDADGNAERCVVHHRDA